MSGVGTALAAFGTLKSAYELVRDLRKSNDPAALKAGIEELTDRLLAAREDAMRVIEQLEELKAENSRLKGELSKSEEFQSDKYFLKPTGLGGFSYVEKDVPQGQNSPHYCPNCFSGRKLSILQPTGMHRIALCHGCGNKVRL